MVVRVMPRPAVEPEQAARTQVVDTVELFHFRRQRKLSLRFLAHRLLGVGIQATSHDSIVDARTALQLFQARCPETLVLTWNPSLTRCGHPLPALMQS